MHSIMVTVNIIITESCQEIRFHMFSKERVIKRVGGGVKQGYMEVVICIY